MSLFADDMILYIETLKYQPKINWIIKEFSKVAEYKINIQKSIMFLYTNNEDSEKETYSTKLRLVHINSNIWK